MKKHLASILFAVLAFLCLSFKANADEKTWVDVSNVTEFTQAISKDPRAYIRLTADINFTNTSASDSYIIEGITFKGKITSRESDDNKLGYAITGAKYCIFQKLDSAEIYNVLVTDCTYDGLSDKSGVLAGECYNSNIHDVIFSNISATGNKTGTDCKRMSVVAGYTKESDFKNLLFLDCALVTDGYKLGMVAGEAVKCSFTNCINNAGCSLWADGMEETILNVFYTNAYAGGVCGYADNCTLTQCYNFGIVSSDDDRIGGIIGYGNNTEIVDCKNGGVVKHCTQAGFGREARQKAANSFLKVGLGAGLAAIGSYAILAPAGSSLLTHLKAANSFRDLTAGEAAAEWLLMIEKVPYLEFLSKAGATIFKRYATSTVTAFMETLVGSMPQLFMIVSVACIGTYSVLELFTVTTSPDEIGGIAGTVEDNCTILRCTNAGPVECADTYGGGIVGYLKGSKIEGCYNRSFVKGGNTDIGGIVGYCKDGYITGNLNVGVVTANGTLICDPKVGNIEGKIEGSYNGSNNYFLAEENKVYGESTAIAFTQEKLPSGEIAKKLNDACSSEKIWRQELGTDFYPVLGNDSKPIVTTTTDDYSIEQKIYNAGDFYLAVANPNAHINLENDINLNSFYFMLSTKSNPFKGVINGNGHTMSNCTYESSSKDNITEYGTLGNDAALFPFASGATFKNLTIDGFHITQKDEDEGQAVIMQALLVGTSNGCEYDNITVQNSDILLNADRDYKEQVGGLVAISYHDTFNSCTVESTCRFEGHSPMANTYVGGLVSQATGSKFTLCHNAAPVWADDDYEGGIVAYADSCTIDRCLNSGSITAQYYVGGIAGCVYNTSITKCVNTGIIDDDENKHESWQAGIVGSMKKSGSISNCLNFGEIKYGGAVACGAIDGDRDDAIVYGEGNIYYCKLAGDPWTNLSDTEYAKMTSGEFALSKDWLYQSIDNDIFCERLPVPIPAAGKVLSNILCNGNQSYSNIYCSEAAHTTKSSSCGICSICGKKIFAPIGDVYINSAEDLCALAYSNNTLGNDFSDSFIKFTNDIDMSGVTNYVPVGVDRDHAFCGAVLGNGHRIKNLTIKRTNGQEGTGVFGCVTGNTSIEDLIVDSTCIIFSNGRGIAGIVGCLTQPTNSTDKVTLSVARCGNEAAISGLTNVAGLVGGVYYTDDANLSVSDSYNMGAIAGTKESASLVAYGHKSLSVMRCWNVGDVSGADTNHSMIRYSSESGVTGTFENNYQIDYLDADANAQSKSTNDFMDGTFCNSLNITGAEYNSDPVWGQNLGYDCVPQLTAAGIRHERTMSRTWGTVVLPYKVSSNSDVQFYQVTSCDVSSTEGKLVLTPVTDVAANTPCFFKKLSDDATSVCISKGTNEFTFTEDDPESIVVATGVTGWSIVGSYDKLTELSGVYYMASSKLWRADNPITLPAYRAYLTYTNASPAKSLAIFVDEGNEVDQIGEISADGKINFYDQPVYNLAGQRVTGSAKGIVIIGGKKYLKK